MNEDAIRAEQSSIYLIPCSQEESLVRMSVSGLEAFSRELDEPVEGGLYGCGNMVPGFGFAPLIAYAAADSARGAVGLTVTDTAVTHIAGPLRQHIGNILQELPIFFVTDNVSAEWMAHFAIPAGRVEEGGHPAWLSDGEWRMPREVTEYISEFSPIGNRELSIAIETRDKHVHACSTRIQVVIATDVASCFAAALSDHPFVIALPPQSRGLSGGVSQFDVLQRWAATNGCLRRVAGDGESLKKLLANAWHGDLPGLGEPEKLKFKKRAKETLNRLLVRREIIEHDMENYSLGMDRDVMSAIMDFPDADSNPSGPPMSPCGEELAFGIATAPVEQPPACGGSCISSSKRCRIEVGTVFSPSTHYTGGYFSDGLEYVDSNGTWRTYHGPAGVWEGNKTIAEIITGLIGGKRNDPVSGKSSLPSMLDIGCGPGDFVRCMLDQMWDANGVDISKDGIESADKGVIDRLRCIDVTSRDFRTNETYDLVTALDFWEHIWEKDSDKMIETVKDLLYVGGIHFAVICTRGDGEMDFNPGPGVKFTPENSWLLVSGHINVRKWGYWARKFRHHGFKLRFDLMQLFQVAKAENPGLSSVRSWDAKNVLVVEKV